MNRKIFVTSIILFFVIVCTYIFQIFIGDPYLFLKAQKNVNNQLKIAPGYKIIDTIEFDDLYLWSLEKENQRIQIRVIPSYFSSKIKIIITSVKDEKATSKCFNYGDFINIKGIIGDKDNLFAKKTGIIFNSLQDIDANLNQIINIISDWSRDQNNTDNTQPQISVFYNCERRVY